MKVEEAIQSLQSLYSKGVQSKDTRLSSRHIYSTLINARTTVLKQQANKKQRINEACYQPLDCLKLEKAPIHDCPCAPTGDKFILRTEQELPKIISSLDKPIIQFISSIDGSIRFDKTTFETVKYNWADKYTSTKPRYYIRKNRLYITAITMMKAVSASVVAEDPIQATLVTSLCEECESCACKSYLDMEFYTDRDTFKSVLALAEDELIRLFGQISEDNIANASDDSNIQGKMVHQ